MTIMPNSVPFSVVSLALIVGLNILKRRTASESSQQKAADLNEFLDWIDPQVESTTNNATKPTALEAEADSNAEHSLFRGLAALGMAPTSPRQARPSRKSLNAIPEHPATGNDEFADETVHLKRVSEEEEAERYFSAFSCYS